MSEKLVSTPPRTRESSAWRCFGLKRNFDSTSTIAIRQVPPFKCSSGKRSKMQEGTQCARIALPMFYTRKGDKGVCDLGSGKRVPKTDSVIAAVGMLDELNSFLGLVRNQQVSVRTKRELLNAQEKLFIIQAQVAIL